ncbi:MAG: hypothetical protein WBB76_12100 [Gaiellaceae bacterium]
MTPPTIVRADAVFETALGVVLVVGTGASWLGPADFPAPVGTPLLIAFGGALLPVGGLLWQLASTPVSPALLRTLATANLATAAAALAWRIAASGFSTAGSTLTLSTTGVLAALAATQLRAARPIVSPA